MWSIYFQPKSLKVCFILSSLEESAGDVYFRLTPITFVLLNIYCCAPFIFNQNPSRCVLPSSLEESVYDNYFCFTPQTFVLLTICFWDPLISVKMVLFILRNSIVWRICWWQLFLHYTKHFCVAGHFFVMLLFSAFYTILYYPIILKGCRGLFSARFQMFPICRICLICHICAWFTMINFFNFSVYFPLASEPCNTKGNP